MCKKVLILGEIVPGIQLQGRNLSGPVIDSQRISGYSHVLSGQGIERACFLKEQGVDPLLYIVAGDDANGNLLDLLLQKQDLSYTLKQIHGEMTGNALLGENGPICIFSGSSFMEVPEGMSADGVILEAENLDPEQMEAFAVFFESIREKGGLCMTDLGEISDEWAFEYSKKLIRASDLVCFRISGDAEEEIGIPSGTAIVFRNASGSWIYLNAEVEKDLGQMPLAETVVFHSLLMQEEAVEVKSQNQADRSEEKDPSEWGIVVPSAAGVASSLKEVLDNDLNEKPERYELTICTGTRNPKPLLIFLKKELKPEKAEIKPYGILELTGIGNNVKNNIAWILLDRKEILYYDLSVRSV